MTVLMNFKKPKDEGSRHIPYRISSSRHALVGFFLYLFVAATLLVVLRPGDSPIDLSLSSTTITSSSRSASSFCFFAHALPTPTNYGGGDHPLLDRRNRERSETEDRVREMEPLIFELLSLLETAKAWYSTPKDEGAAESKRGEEEGLPPLPAAQYVRKTRSRGRRGPQLPDPPAALGIHMTCRKFKKGCPMSYVHFLETFTEEIIQELLFLLRSHPPPPPQSEAHPNTTEVTAHRRQVSAFLRQWKQYQENYMMRVPDSVQEKEAQQRAKAAAAMEAAALTSERDRKLLYVDPSWTSKEQKAMEHLINYFHIVEEKINSHNNANTQHHLHHHLFLLNAVSRFIPSPVKCFFRYTIHAKLYDVISFFIAHENETLFETAAEVATAAAGAAAVQTNTPLPNEYLNDNGNAERGTPQPNYPSAAPAAPTTLASLSFLLFTLQHVVEYQLLPCSLVAWGAVWLLCGSYTAKNKYMHHCAGGKKRENEKDEKEEKGEKEKERRVQLEGTHKEGDDTNTSHQEKELDKQTTNNRISSNTSKNKKSETEVLDLYHLYRRLEIEETYETVLLWFRLRFALSLFLVLFFTCTFLCQMNLFLDYFTFVYSAVVSLPSLPQRLSAFRGTATSSSLVNMDKHSDNRYTPMHHHKNMVSSFSPSVSGLSSSSSTSTSSGFFYRTGMLLSWYTSYTYALAPVYFLIGALLVQGVWQSYEDYRKMKLKAAMAMAEC